MGKAEAGTPKDIAKRIKAKGLQKLKFWCQMCNKQCRDSNGFKCHLTSETHLRQMKLFSEQANTVLNSYSREFERVYLDCLRVRHTTNEVNANHVYQEVIQDKHHVHMNATIWASLSDFVKYLGKTGKCHVRETDRGWYIQYIEQDVSKLAQQESYRKRQAAEAEAEQIEHQRIEQQRIEAAKALDRANVAIVPEATKLDRRTSSGTDANNPSLVKVSLVAGKSGGSGKKNTPTSAVSNVLGGEDEDSEDEMDEPPPPASLPILPPSTTTATSHSSQKRPKHEDQQPDVEKSHKKSRHEGPDLSTTTTWLLPDILVKLIDPTFSKSLLHRKAIVDHILPSGSVAQVTILDSGPDINDGGQVVQVNETQVETVVGKVGKRVVILKGKHRGQIAKTLELNPKKNRAVLQLKDGTVLERVHYDDFSKAA